MDRIRRWVKAMSAFCLALLVGVFAVACADINDKSFEITQNLGESNDNQSNLGESTSKPQVSELPTTTEIAKLFESIGIAKSIKSTKFAPNAIHKKATPKQSIQTKNTAQDSRKTHKIQTQDLRHDSQMIPATRTQDLSVITSQNPQDSQTHAPSKIDLEQIHKDSQAIEAQNLKDSKDSQDFATNPPQDSHIINQSAPKAKFSFDTAKLDIPISQLQAHCDAHDLQQCEDLGRIYAAQEKRDLSIAHYKRACDSGKGLFMSCFFLSLIYANNGDSASAQKYLNVIEKGTLESHKIDEAELLLSIGEIALIKEKLRNFCANGESTLCNVLLGIYEIRGENSEAKTFFSAECKRGNKTPCDILGTLP